MVNTRASHRASSRVNKAVRKLKTTNYTSYLGAGRRSLRLVIRDSIQDALLHSEALVAERERQQSASPVSSSASSTSSSAPSTPTRKRLSSSSATSSPSTTRSYSPAVDLSNGIPSKRKGWYYISCIVNEICSGDKVKYLVEWEGEDPKTGVKWPAEWVDKKHVSKSAMKCWEAKKDELLGGPAI